MAQNLAKINMADVARAAGVSMATASRALNNESGVAEATRRRVLAIAEELSYVVSPEASRLAGGATGRVAVVVPHLSRWYFGALLEGLESVLRAADLDVLLYHVGGIDDRHDFFHRLPARRKVDAVVVLAFPVEEEEQRRLSLMGVTIIAAGGQHAPYPNVSIDDETAGRQAMDHLLFLGHRRIAMIAAVDPDQPDDEQPSGRSNAYHAALREAGIPFDERLVVTVDWGGAEGADAMAKLLSQPQPPTAVYAHSDEVALGAVRTLRRSGLRVPDDISVIGIDDHPLAELTDLTTVRQPVRQQGELAGRMLMDILRGDRTDHDVVVPTQLVIRGSTAPPRT
ncbi:LacI family DNA-binding transcriptional regulator [Amycolatopsis sp. EV170708-02-1]|uniref:LacI family DNA-binding transcriptional regulator n=1 Tax=Amycolatopsis sp. EV170708-02-1 TaxID=2919322 RepID=UPI001F0CAD15|nr:LacI family DNA-binding transcriptional regulator [Amycolatopsis sp. EV170708-02-1]UMP00110.1 LacI family transcriptional regulator [Amycolatopsis sp. EV170708-02-1]